jgi:hypothetical protein
VTVPFADDGSWAILSPVEQSIKRKIEAAGTPLKNWDVKINYGIKTGCNEAFIIDGAKRAELIAADPASADIIRPILRGRDIRRYGYEFGDKYVILAAYGSHKSLESKYPAIYAHLSAFKERLEQRGQCRYAANGKPNLKTPFPGQHHWLELDNNPRQDYLDDFSKRKIIYSEIVREPQFHLDDEGFFPEATAFIMTGEHVDYLIHILNSPLVAWVFKTYYSGGGLGEEGYRYKKAFLENLPVPRVFDTVLDVHADEIIAKTYSFSAEEFAFVKRILKNP